MSGTLSPDVIAAINHVAATPLGRKYDRMARRRYGKSGVALAAKEVLGESGGRRNAVSRAGARGLTQFIPSTRDEVLRQTGYDAYGSNKDAIAAMMSYQLKRGVEGYNPGMSTYKDYILGQRIDPATNRALKRGGSSGGTAGVTITGPKQTTVSLPESTIPGQSFAAERDAAKQALFLGGGKLTMQKLLAYKQQVDQLQDIPSRKVTGDLQVKTTGGQKIRIPGDTPLGGGPAGKGTFKITGPNPGRLKPELLTYARKVARVYGHTLTGSDGTGHSRLTVNGNVSEHTTGNATDIPATGRELIRMGRAALIAAGMPRAEALKQTGGLFNVGNHQIIFNTHEGGDHTNHLHISTHARR